MVETGGSDYYAILDPDAIRFTAALPDGTAIGAWNVADVQITHSPAPRRGSSGSVTLYVLGQTAVYRYRVL